MQKKHPVLIWKPDAKEKAKKILCKKLQQEIIKNCVKKDSILVAFSKRELEIKGWMLNWTVN